MREEVGDARPEQALRPRVPRRGPFRDKENEGNDFFGKRGAIQGVGAALVGPLLYANIVLGAPGGGGYLDLPTDGAALRAQIIGPSLWETAWANVLPRGFSDRLAAGPWPALCDPMVFPWLDPSLADMPLRRKAEGFTRQVTWALHPAFVPLILRTSLGSCSRASSPDLEAPAHPR